MPKKGETKHNKKELDKRARETVLKNGGAGGGKKDADARKNKTLKCLIKCKICMGMQPNVHSMSIHYEAKHSKIKWDDALKASYEAMAAGGK